MSIDLCNTELLYTTNQEQGVEVEYVLPDYCPDIFKVLKSKICTRVLSYRLEGKRLEIDGMNIVTVVYIGEEDNRMRQLEQRLIFTKNIDLSEEYQDSYVKLNTKTNYLNCKVQNPRKIDIRGAVNICVNIFGKKTKQINTEWDEVQVHEKSYDIVAPILHNAKNFTLKEELEMGAGKVPIQDIISYEAFARPLSYKLLANKAICKGELVLHTLYTGSKDPCKPEWVEHTVPISRIVDFDEVDEDYTLDFYFDVTKYDVDLKVDEDGECRTFTAEVGLRICCEASKNVKTQVIDDCYSTKYETTIKKDVVKFEKMQSVLNDTVMLTNQMTLTDVELGEICHISGEVVNISSNANIVNYALKVSVLILDKDGTPSILEETFANEYKLPNSDESVDLSTATTRINLHSDLKSISYHMINASVCEIRSELCMSGVVYTSFDTDVILSLDIDTETQKEKSTKSAIKVYFTQENETMWDIAKKYNTTISEIIDYNFDNDDVDINPDMDKLDTTEYLDKPLKSREIILIPN